MIATKDEIIEALQGAVEETRGEVNVIVPVLFLEDLLELLKEQKKIVRCKDCKYCEYPDSDKEWCKKGHLHGKAETWFCADAESR